MICIIKYAQMYVDDVGWLDICIGPDMFCNQWLNIWDEWKYLG